MPFIVDKTVSTTLLLRETMAVDCTAKCILWNSSFFNVSLNSKTGSGEQKSEMNDYREILGSLRYK